MSVLSKPYFHDEKAAFAKLESVLWPNGSVCPHCGSTGKHYDLSKTRIGLRKCAEKACRKQFTVRVGTVFESSHIPLHKWFQAVHLLCFSKKGISSHQLHRVLEVTYKTAWFMSHRIREAMRSGPLAPPLGGNGGIVEVDETYIGNKSGTRRRGKRPSAYRHKFAVLTLVERDGSARSFQIERAKSSTVVPVVSKNVSHEATVMTDGAKHYTRMKIWFADHEYVRGDVHTNTVEGYFSIFERGMKGVYQHCSEKHLHRYLAEFDFRYNNRSAKGVEDETRSCSAMRGAVGKRLTYRTACPEVSA